MTDQAEQNLGGWRGIEICILPYVKEMTSPSLMHETGQSKPVHWDNPEGWDGEGGGREVHMYIHG